MNAVRERFSSSTLIGAGPRSGRSAPAPASQIDPIGPIALADLMLAAALRGEADFVLLRVEDDVGTVSLTSGAALLGRLRVPADVGSAAAARLAIVAGLDPLIEAGSLEGRSNVARARIRAGDERGEVLVSACASARGIDVEVHPLVRGRRARGRNTLKRCATCGAYQPAQRDACDRDGGALIEVADDPRPGGTVGAYRVHEKLGEGSMGSVLAGEHAIIGRPVAIKVIHRSLAETPAVARRFLCEARAASRLKHPNVVEVTDFGLLDDGRPFIVMERLAGESLERHIERAGALPPRAALLVAREVALALDAAHAAGVLHNDLKPGNVLLLDGATEDAPRVKLVDFGAAHLSGDVDSPDELVIGTPHYMSPERARGEPGDARADLYSLGIALHEMLSGEVPFLADSAHAVLLAQMRQIPPPPASPHGALPQRVTRLVARLLAKKPAERHQSARELVADIDGALEAVSRTGWRSWLP